jgi:TRAP transporter TAXI family solute receptor
MRIRVGLVGAVFAVLACPACARRGDAHGKPPRQVVRFTTAFGPFVNPLVEDYRRTLPDVDVRAVPTADSAAAVAAIEGGTADFGLAYADAVYATYATHASRRSATVLRGVSVLEPLPLYVLTRKNSGIERVGDIRGRRIAVAAPGVLASWSLGDLLLRAVGVDPASVRSLPRTELVTGLTDGTLDAVLISGWVQTMRSQFEGLRASTRVLPVEGAPIEQLRAQYPFIRPVTVPRVLYAGQEHPVRTVGMDVLVVCRSDLSEAVVYEATKHLFIAYPSLSNVEATLRFLNLDEAPATPIPLHPGAARYFRERELSR